MRNAVYTGLFLITLVSLFASSCVGKPPVNTPTNTPIPMTTTYTPTTQTLTKIPTPTPTPNQTHTPAQTAQPSTTTQPTAFSPTLPQTTDRNIVIDHTNWDWYNSQSQQVIYRVAMQKVFFAHASIGSNIMQGFADLNSADALKYPLAQISSGAIPPATTMNGTIFEYPRGNPGWSAKVSSFETYVTNGWHYPKINIAMNKLCAVDQDADWVAYCNSIAGLEIANPTTKFVYFTMPYYATSDYGNVLRNQYNQSMRNWIATQSNKIFFDIADIEAWSPTAVHQTFIVRGMTYEKLYSGYSSDGVHLNIDGRKRMATGLYSLFGKIISN